MNKEILEHRIKEERRIINVCREKYPKQFLCIESIYLYGELFPVGIFKCMKCNKPILHRQFNFGRLCARCDVGKESSKWVVEKPMELQVADEL